MIAAAILIGLAANADNLSIGIAYGIQRRQIGLAQNVLIAIATSAVTLAAILAGQELHRRVLPALPNWLGGMMLILLAVAGLMRPIDRESDAISIGPVGWCEVAFVSASLSVNNIGLAVAGGFADVPYTMALASVFCFSIALLSAGQLVAGRAARRLGDALRQAWVGNFVLLAAGLMMLVGM